MLDFQLWLRGITLGAGTQFHVLSVSGLGTKPRSVLTPNQVRHGARLGKSYLAEREITIKLLIRSSAYLDASAAWQWLCAAWNAVGDGGDQEHELKMQLPGFGERFLLGRAQQADFGGLERLKSRTIEAELKFQDTRGHTLGASTTLPVGLTGATPGQSWPAPWPWNFGGLGSGQLIVPTSGDMPTYPLLRIEGGCTNPRVTNSATGEFSGVSGVLAPGEWVELDMRAATVLHSSGASWRSKLTPGSTWWALDGSTAIHYTASGDSGSSLALTWRDNYNL